MSCTLPPRLAFIRCLRDDLRSAAEASFGSSFEVDALIGPIAVFWSNAVRCIQETVEGLVQIMSTERW